MVNRVLDGRGIAAEIRRKLKMRIDDLKLQWGIVPGLATIIVGDDEASKAYVTSKEKVCKEAGLYTENYELPACTSMKELVRLITSLNNNDKVNGILLQVPLPTGLDEKLISRVICENKDVDGFNPINIGNLYAGRKCFIPCTPKGIMKLIEQTGVALEGKHAVVIGRSNIVGKPVSALLLNRSATVTICHSKTINLHKHTMNADIIVSAVGKPGFITGNMVKKGAIVIDAGTTMVGGKLTGDVIFDEVKDIASWITPVPGGVGAMTTTMLIENTIEAAEVSK